MIRVAERLEADRSPARMLLQVHDELLFEVPRDGVDALVAMVRETMEGAVTLDVPLTVDIKAGDDWESMRPVPRAARRRHRRLRLRRMPELPEVETVARDLRPRLVGATIVGVR